MLYDNLNASKENPPNNTDWGSILVKDRQLIPSSNKFIIIHVFNINNDIRLMSDTTST